MPSPEIFPIILGVTGHLYLDPRAEAGIAAVVEALLAHLHDKCHKCLHVMTGTNTASDRIVARVADKLGIPRIIVRFAGTTLVDPLWTSVHQDVQLPTEPGPLGSFGNTLLFNTFMLRRCHIMLNLWDGALPDLNDHVITPGDIASIHSAMRGRSEDTLLTGTESPLEAESDAPWVQIMAPRPGWTPPPSSKSRLYSCSVFEPSGTLIASDVPPTCVFDTLPDWHQKAIKSINFLNNEVRTMRRIDRKTFDAQVSYLNLAEDLAHDDLDPAQIDLLVAWQCGADSIAQKYQRRLLGIWWPSHGFTDMMKRVRGFVKGRGGFPTLGVLFWFAVAVPAAILLLESFAHLKDFLQEEWRYRALIGYVVIFVVGLLYFVIRVRRNAWQDRFQDYRALAEAMRVQLFWALSGLQAATADNYLHKHRLELGWIQYLQRGPAITAAEVARRVLASRAGPRRRIVVKNWVKDQQEYFETAAARNKHSAHNHQAWLNTSVLSTAGAAILLAIVATLKHIHVTWISEDNLHWMKDFLVVAAATFPAIAAALGISMEGRAFESHAQSYALMSTIFSRARRIEPTIQDPRAFHSLMLDLGREALNETSEWLMDHRHRPIEHKAA